ncbi:hypothetical protein MNBD_CHLOROFLEXI01-340 [hydrothermal vent metagenome]|uniref:DUF3368 domain-containing protein n=1 Tax=hydrothermal vent metagenome TaxID=652676 RepID=A0A3B0VL85_9ZZZZ
MLRVLYEELLIPTSVWVEAVEKGKGKPGSTEISSAAWIKRHSVENMALVQALRQDLDAGESEAIALALETQADLLLMDERLGRSTAQYFGLRYIGSIGILATAKKRKLITEIRPRLDKLRKDVGFYLSDALYDRVLEDANEL